MAAFVAGIAMSACIAAPCTEPISAGVLAHVVVPTLRGDDPELLGACAPWVVVNGVYYRDRRSEGWEFDLTDADLVEAGEATEASPLVGELAGPTVFSIDDLAPKDFLAIQAADGSFFIIAPDGGSPVDVAEVLCRYATGSDFMLDENCRGDELLPSG